MNTKDLERCTEAAQAAVLLYSTVRALYSHGSPMVAHAAFNLVQDASELHLALNRLGKAIQADLEAQEAQS